MLGCALFIFRRALSLRILIDSTLVSCAQGNDTFGCHVTLWTYVACIVHKGNDTIEKATILLVATSHAGYMRQASCTKATILLVPEMPQL